jgi:hypothetical protein
VWEVKRALASKAISTYPVLTAKRKQLKTQGRHKGQNSGPVRRRADSSITSSRMAGSNRVSKPSDFKTNMPERQPHARLSVGVAGKSMEPKSNECQQDLNLPGCK